MSARRLPANAQRLKQDYGSLIFSNRNCILNVEMQVCVHIIVQGMVQGVGFRYYVQRQAMKLNLSGFARNLYNGDVEIEAEGDRSLVEEFIKEVKVGPSSAYVKDLKIEWKEFQNRHKGFEVR
jgi:acylphosphatase